jgi:hypothetical protein
VRPILLIGPSSGARITATNAKYRTPLHNAGEAVARRTCRYLGQFVTDPTTELRHIGKKEHWTDIIVLLCRNGADINAKDSLGYTPLHVVCFTFSYETYLLAFRLTALQYGELFPDADVFRYYINLFEPMFGYRYNHCLLKFYFVSNAY